ncbi:PREDICTED: uncharacterized protein LOC108758952 [Trachymyrmex cornetzi]|uniref:uncharacterized protein LOC108758952 n=1 Tax=Trachymyrmex cornetzi TaxID=471704 RepID=UPI00084F7CAE|nr:PREDICTED: uncharacterized protein LOC108758952 [Trachymyrmex cornetzi]
MIIIGVYISPSIDREYVDKGMDEILDLVLEHKARPTIVAGDFNAKSPMWGSTTTNTKEVVVERWTVANGLCCINTGSASTCVRPQEESIVDVTFANPLAAAKIEEWRVLLEETLSDHFYISIVLGDTAAQRRRRKQPRPQRWRLHSLNEDLLTAAILAHTWGMPPPAGRPIDEEAEKLRGMVRACDVAMLRALPRAKRAMPWWTVEIASLRDGATRARRRLKRACRRRGDQEEIEWYLLELREARAVLRSAIARVKEQSWRDLMLSLEDDPSPWVEGNTIKSCHG